VAGILRDRNIYYTTQ